MTCQKGQKKEFQVEQISVKDQVRKYGMFENLEKMQQQEPTVWEELWEMRPAGWAGDRFGGFCKSGCLHRDSSKGNALKDFLSRGNGLKSDHFVSYLIISWRSRSEARILMRSSWKNPGNSVVVQHMMMAAQMESGGWLKEIYRW